jgi:NAD(P)-dependent dehydrogenase (short-subunit alcohol dehydrogenase family)
MIEAGASPTGQKVALVTGGNRGIGWETALQLGRLGVHVIVGVRDLSKVNRVVADFHDRGLSRS